MKISLGIDVQGDGKVLPLLEVNRGGPEQRGVAVEELERVRGHVRVCEHGARLEHELVPGVVRRLVEDVEVLVAEVEGTGGVLLYAPVHRLEALVARAALVGVIDEKKSRAAEAILLLENGLVADGDLDGLVRSVIEAGVGHFREQQDVAPGQVVTLGVAIVEEDVVDVKICERRRGRNTTLEDYRTLNHAG